VNRTGNPIARLTPRRAPVPDAVRDVVVARVGAIGRGAVIREARISESTLLEVIERGMLLPQTIARIEAYITTLGGSP
jgi:hypothetical protein